MTTRIGIFTKNQNRKKGQPSTVATYIDVVNPSDLSTKVIALGAKQAGLMRRDRDGNTTLEGEMFDPAKFNNVHLEWLAATPPEFQTRGVFYD